MGVMKIIAVADTHLQSWQIPEKLVQLMESADLVVHAGDFVSYEVYEKFSEFELIAVRGDNDDPALSGLPEISKFRAGDLEIGVVHKGNYLNIFDDLLYKAMEINVDLLIFGHIHRFVFEKIKNRAILCPGSPTEPRMSFASCAEILIDKKEVEVKCHLVQPIFCSLGGEDLEGIGWGKKCL